MISDPKNYSVPADFYDNIIDELEKMETGIVGEKSNLQTQVDDANGAVLTCNTNKDSTLAGSVADAKVVVDNRNDTHHACRGVEVSDSTAKNSSCGKLETDTSTTS